MLVHSHHIAFTQSRPRAQRTQERMAERATGRPWTAEEDELLQRAVAKHGENDMWKTIALCVPGRTNKACRKVRTITTFVPGVRGTDHPS